MLLQLTSPPTSLSGCGWLWVAVGGKWHECMHACMRVWLVVGGWWLAAVGGKWHACMHECSGGGEREPARTRGKESSLISGPPTHTTTHTLLFQLPARPVVRGQCETCGGALLHAEPA